MLDTTIVIVVCVWFIVIPIILEVSNWFLNTSKPEIFNFSIYVKAIAVGLVFTIVSYRVDIVNIYAQNTMSLRSIVYIDIVTMILWESYKLFSAYKTDKHCLTDDNIVFSCIVAKYFSKNSGYDAVISETMLRKPQWECILDIVDISKPSVGVLEKLKDYTETAEKKAIKRNDKRLLKVVERVKLKYLT